MYSLNWPYIKEAPSTTAQFKLSPDDFHVNELFEGTFSGEGEHILLKIEKKGVTTEEVVKSLSRLINKSPKLISYAGLKDRQALTTQWISIHAPGEEIEGVGVLQAPGWKVIEHTRHNKKLRPGYLSGNEFMIRLRDITQTDEIIDRINSIQLTGVPNYFGEQRFGRDAGNLLRAEEVLVQGKKIKDRFLKGMYFSAARSWIFNLILAQRVTDGSWNKPLNGDVMQLRGSNSIFIDDDHHDELVQRITKKDVSPASPLPGRGKSMVSKQALRLIEKIYDEWQPWIHGLEKNGLEEAWRANILHIDCITHELVGSDMELRFTLPPGAYATVVLRELVKY